MRSVLAAAGALPARDERLVKLERWITAAISAREDPGERQILHGYAIWHHLRRLRQRPGTTHATHLQVVNVRCHVTAAASFLDWLAAQGLALSSCAQPDLDRWASGDITYRDETAHFVRWSVTHRHASRLTFGAVRWDGPRGPHDGEKRWDDARRLLHDDTLTTSDRVAGLLLLLYAQRIASIAKLTTGHIRDHGDRVEIMLGTAPVVLPEPLAGLVRELLATRPGHAAIGRPGTTPWLFPGGRPGQPIGEPRSYHPVPANNVMPVQEPGTKRARPLPYQPSANLDGFTFGSNGAVQAKLSFSNNGPHVSKASHFSVYNNVAPDVNIADYPNNFPGQYTIDPSPTIWNKTVPGSAEIGAGRGDGRYDLTIVGLNRFLRHFTGDVSAPGVTAQVTAAYYQGGFGPKPMLALKLTNSGKEAVTFTVTPNYYSKEPVRTYHVHAHGSATHVVDPLVSSNGWYDLSVTISGDDSWSRRYVGHLEDGKASITG